MPQPRARETRQVPRDRHPGIWHLVPVAVTRDESDDPGMADASLRERNKTRNREALVAASRRLFAERGYDATTVDDIAEAAGVSRRSFFRYFETKEAIALPDHPARLARFRALLASAPGRAPFERVRHALIAVAREYETNRDLVLEEQRVISAAAPLVSRELAWDREWEAAMAETLADGARSDARKREARVLAGATIGAARAALREWFDRGGNLVRLGEHALDLIDPSQRREGC